jgi:hypothetical protein
MRYALSAASEQLNAMSQVLKQPHHEPRNIRVVLYQNDSQTNPPWSVLSRLRSTTCVRTTDQIKVIDKWITAIELMFRKSW